MVRSGRLMADLPLSIKQVRKRNLKKADSLYCTYR
jgi:hypothetical protein